MTKIYAYTPHIQFFLDIDLIIFNNFHFFGDSSLAATSIANIYVRNTIS